MLGAAQEGEKPKPKAPEAVYAPDLAAYAKRYGVDPVVLTSGLLAGCKERVIGDDEVILAKDTSLYDLMRLYTPAVAGLASISPSEKTYMTYIVDRTGETVDRPVLGGLAAATVGEGGVIHVGPVVVHPVWGGGAVEIVLLRVLLEAIIEGEERSPLALVASVPFGETLNDTLYHAFGALGFKLVGMCYDKLIMEATMKRAEGRRSAPKGGMMVWSLDEVEKMLKAQIEAYDDDAAKDALVKLLNLSTRAATIEYQRRKNLDPSEKAVGDGIDEGDDDDDEEETVGFLFGRRWCRRPRCCRAPRKCRRRACPPRPCPPKRACAVCKCCPCACCTRCGRLACVCCPRCCLPKCACCKRCKKAPGRCACCKTCGCYPCQPCVKCRCCPCKCPKPCACVCTPCRRACCVVKKCCVVCRKKCTRVCPTCKVMRYCGEACQARDWPVHINECTSVAKQ